MDFEKFKDRISSVALHVVGALSQVCMYVFLRPQAVSLHALEPPI